MEGQQGARGTGAWAARGQGHRSPGQQGARDTGGLGSKGSEAQEPWRQGVRGTGGLGSKGPGTARGQGHQKTDWRH